jgi:hypothetical protein
LPNIYREFLKDGEVEIFWNGQRLEAEAYPILTAPPQWDLSQPTREWDEEVELSMDDGRTIRGRIFLLQKMKRSYTALNLFWHKRLILGNVGDNHRPVELFGAANSFETGRLCVELHLDEYEPTVDKMGFKFQDSESTLEEIIEVLKREASTLIRQAREYREPRVSSEDQVPDIGPIISQPASEIVVRPAEATKSDPYPAPSKNASTSSPSRKIASVDLVVDKGLEWEIQVALGYEAGENMFVNIEETPPNDVGGKQRLLITLGMQHPFVVHYWSDDANIQRLMMILASSIGFGEIAARRAGAKYPSYVRNNVDNFLRLVALGSVSND